MSLISKQIDELRAYAKDRKGELAKLINDAADTIEMLSAKLHASQMERSSQYYHGGWIPCSERLPEDGQDVLFCDIDEDIMLGYHVKGRPNTHFTQCGSWDEIKNVFAWMPLPEPWRGEEHVQSRG